MSGLTGSADSGFWIQGFVRERRTQEPKVLAERVSVDEEFCFGKLSSSFFMAGVWAVECCTGYPPWSFRLGRPESARHLCAL